MRYTGRIRPIVIFANARRVRGEVVADARLCVESAVGSSHDREGAFFLSRMLDVGIWRGKEMYGAGWDAVYCLALYYLCKGKKRKGRDEECLVHY